MGIFPSAKSEKKQKRAVAEREEARAQLTASMAKLVEEVEETGQELAGDPTGTHLERYRRSVRQLLDAAVHETMQVSSERSMGLSRKVFSTITRVDIALADLADAVLGRQQDLGKVRDLVHQIKGLLIDMYR